MSLTTPLSDGTTRLSSGSTRSSLRSLDTNGLTRTRPATSGPRSSASRSATDPPIDRAPTTTASVRARSRSSARSASAYQSVQATRLRSCQLVAWPGSSGTSTAYPRSARNRAQGVIEAGEPLNPCSSSTPSGRPPVSSGRASAENGAASGGIVMRRILHQTGRAVRGCPVARRTRLRTTVDRAGTDGLGEGATVFYWFLKWIAIGPVLRVVFRPRAEGAQNVPVEGPAILASNHLSYADWLFMPLTLPRRVTFVAKAEYFTGPGLKGWLQKTFFSGAGQVPIDRSGASAAEGALSAAKRILDEGDLFGIYPEGTGSHDGRLYRGKTGVARLALETGVPVIPVAVLGTDVVAPPGKKFGTFTRPGVRFGKPLDFSRYEGMENDRYILRSISDEIMYEIMRLSEQEYVDMYASKAKELDKEKARQAEREKAEREKAAREQAEDGPEQKAS